MRHPISATAAGISLAFGLSAQVHAATQTRTTQIPASVACQLSMPTIDTSVRAKATGFRNEGTASTFIICGMESANSQEALGTIKGLSIGLYSLNGASATVSCTAVNGYANSTPLYATKTLPTPTNGTAGVLSWDASDFGGTAGDPLAQNDYWSITCNLPAKTSVGYMVTQFNVNTPAV